MCSITINCDCQDHNQDKNGNVIIPLKANLVFKTKMDGTQDDTKQEIGDLVVGIIEGEVVVGKFLGGQPKVLSSYDVLEKGTFN